VFMCEHAEGVHGQRKVEDPCANIRDRTYHPQFHLCRFCCCGFHSSNLHPLGKKRLIDMSVDLSEFYESSL